MESFSALAMPIVNTLGASGYPALQTLLSYVIDNSKNRFLVLSGKKKMFFLLLAAATLEMLGEVF
jgi:hypothetical protein